MVCYANPPSLYIRYGFFIIGFTAVKHSFLDFALWMYTWIFQSKNGFSFHCEPFNSLTKVTYFAQNCSIYWWNCFDVASFFSQNGIFMTITGVLIANKLGGMMYSSSSLFLSHVKLPLSLFINLRGFSADVNLFFVLLI